MDKNCPSCGAPYDVILDKCPYCGTSYFDMSCIDINSNNPFYIKLRSGNTVFTSKVVAEPLSYIALSSDRVYIENPIGETVMSFITSINADIDIRFHSIVDGDGKLFKVEKV